MPDDSYAQLVVCLPNTSVDKTAISSSKVTYLCSFIDEVVVVLMPSLSFSQTNHRTRHTDLYGKPSI
jgi:fumarate reductase subunit D